MQTVLIVAIIAGAIVNIVALCKAAGKDNFKDNEEEE